MPFRRYEKAVLDLPHVKQCCLLILPRPTNPIQARVHLLVFTGIKPEDEGSSLEDKRSTICEKITEAVGSNFVPERIEHFALAAPSKEDAIDRNWCLSQYTSGKLFQKNDTPVYKHIHALRASIDEAMGLN